MVLYKEVSFPFLPNERRVIPHSRFNIVHQLVQVLQQFLMLGAGLRFALYAAYIGAHLLIFTIIAYLSTLYYALHAVGQAFVILCQVFATDGT